MKIGIVGAGNVGGTLAMRVLEKGFGEVVLIDVLKGLAQGKALDLNEAGPVMNFEPRIIGTDDYAHLKGADIVVITAGLPRAPGMTREELMARNLDIVRTITKNVVAASPKCIIIVVTNPLDLMTYAVYKISGFPRERVIGMGGVLDGSRLAYFISEKLKVSMKEIVTMVIGPHSDSMLVVPRFTTVSGRPITEFLKEDEIKEITDRTRNGGAEVVNLLKSGGSFYASSAAILKIVESIVSDSGEILPCSVFLQGEYAIMDICIGVPVRIGMSGVKEVVELKLNAAEKECLACAAESLKEQIRDMDERIR